MLLSPAVWLDCSCGVLHDTKVFYVYRFDMAPDKYKVGSTPKHAFHSLFSVDLLSYWFKHVVFADALFYSEVNLSFQ